MILNTLVVTVISASRKRAKDDCP